MAKQIYLSGAITGLSYEGANNWRVSVEELLKKATSKKIEVYNPVRTFPQDEFDDATEYYAMKVDVRKLVSSDVVICNISSNPYSIGTNMEIAIAYEHRIPVYIYNPYGDKLHPWQILMSDKSFTSMEDLIEEVCRVVF